MEPVEIIAIGGMLVAFHHAAIVRATASLSAGSSRRSVMRAREL